MGEGSALVLSVSNAPKAEAENNRTQGRIRPIDLAPINRDKCVNEANFCTVVQKLASSFLMFMNTSIYRRNNR
jgi:hypothetical protein